MSLRASVDDERLWTKARPKSTSGSSSRERTLRFGDRTFSYDEGQADALNRGNNRDMEPKECDKRDPFEKWDGVSNNNRATAAASFPSESFGSNRKVIHLDMSAVNRLLSFDEEDEEEADKELDADDAEEENISMRASQNSWRKAVTKNVPSHAPPAPRQMQRRHSISATDLPRRIRPDSALNQQPMFAGSAASDLPAYRLNLQEMHSALKSEFSRNAAIGCGPKPMSASAQSLRLDEISHIRVVSSKAELCTRTISQKTRAEVERGKLCFVCMKTHFGFFSHGSKCEMCKQTICHKCHSKMRIPVDLLPATPNFSERKLPLPNHAGLFPMPTSLAAPQQQRVWPQQAGFGTALTSSRILPPHQIQRGPHVSQPKQMAGRRMSLAAGTLSAPHREQSESALLTVCTECKDVVLQVIRASRTSERMQTMHSMVMGLASSPP